jgi:hypothetical protein
MHRTASSCMTRYQSKPLVSLWTDWIIITKSIWKRWWHHYSDGERRLPTCEFDRHGSKGVPSCKQWKRQARVVKRRSRLVAQLRDFSEIPSSVRNMPVNSSVTIILHVFPGFKSRHDEFSNLLGQCPMGIGSGIRSPSVPEDDIFPQVLS